MRKLYKLKKWYSIEDAAKRLSVTLGEPVEIQDVRQLMGDGHIAAYWNISSRPAREVALATIFHSEGDPLFDLTKSLGSLSDGCERFMTEKLEPQQPYVQPIEGLFKIDSEAIGAARHWLQAIAQGKESENTSLDGAVVIGEDGKQWQLMEHYSDNEYAKNFVPTTPWGNPDNFYPTFDLPDVADIVISKAELENFEAQFIEAPEAEKPLSTSERNSLLKIILGMAMAGYKYDPAASRSSVTKEIETDLTTMGMRVTDDTIRGYLKEAVQHVLPGTR
jgi:hypothetical protein